VKKITFAKSYFVYLAALAVLVGAPANPKGMPMGARSFTQLPSRCSAAAVLATMLTVCSISSAFAIGTPEQRRACTPDVYRLCAGEIPNVRAITVCLQRHKASLSEACRAAMEQSGY
jgi:hypothetical protein